MTHLPAETRVVTMVKSWERVFTSVTTHFLFTIFLILPGFTDNNIFDYNIFQKSKNRGIALPLKFSAADVYLTVGESVWSRW